jgi:hypothetical protein
MVTGDGIDDGRPIVLSWLDRGAAH